MKNKPGPAELARAREVLVREGADGGAEACAHAAGRVQGRLYAHLAPLVGAAGVQALLVRSVKLTQNEFPFLDVGFAEASTKLDACLQAQDPVVAMDSAAALFGTFIALLHTFIGERLTAQVFARAWAPIQEPAPTELRK